MLAEAMRRVIAGYARSLIAMYCEPTEIWGVLVEYDRYAYYEDVTDNNFDYGLRQNDHENERRRWFSRLERKDKKWERAGSRI